MTKNTKTLVGTALLTALVIVLQMLSLVIPPIGPFRISLVLIPIVIGAAMYGYKAGAWLGFVFGVVVVLTDAGAFLAVNVIGTVITCLLKGAVAGLVAGIVYSLIEKKNRTVAVIAAAIVTPIINTGIFLLGCSVFFMDTINQWAAGAGYESAGAFMIGGLVGFNFLIEMAVNIILNPVIIRILDIVKKPSKAEA